MNKLVLAAVGAVVVGCVKNPSKTKKEFQVGVATICLVAGATSYLSNKK